MFTSLFISKQYKANSLVKINILENVKGNVSKFLETSRLFCFVIQDSHQFLNQSEAKLRPMATVTRCTAYVSYRSLFRVLIISLDFLCFL